MSFNIRWILEYFLVREKKIWALKANIVLGYDKEEMTMKGKEIIVKMLSHITLS